MKLEFVEKELKDRFEACFEELCKLDMKSITHACKQYGISTEKVDRFYLRLSDVKIQNGMTPAQVGKLIAEKYKEVPKGYTTQDDYSGGYPNVFTKVTPLFKNGRDAVHALRNKVELDLLLSAVGKNKGYLSIMAEFVRLVENLKNSC